MHSIDREREREITNSTVLFGVAMCVCVSVSVDVQCWSMAQDTAWKYITLCADNAAEFAFNRRSTYWQGIWWSLLVVGFRGGWVSRGCYGNTKTNKTKTNKTKTNISSDEKTSEVLIGTRILSKFRAVRPQMAEWWFRFSFGFWFHSLSFWYLKPVNPLVAFGLATFQRFTYTDLKGCTWTNSV